MTLRDQLEAMIEAAIELLDQRDGDCDLEDDGIGEPSLDPSMAMDGVRRWYWICEDWEGNGHAA